MRLPLCVLSSHLPCLSSAHRTLLPNGVAGGGDSAVPDEDVRHGGGPDHGRDDLLERHRHGVRGVAACRVCTRPSPQALQEQQLLLIRPPAQHLCECPNPKSSACSIAILFLALCSWGALVLQFISSAPCIVDCSSMSDQSTSLSVCLLNSLWKEQTYI